MYPLEAPAVEYRPPGYSVVRDKENYIPRQMCYVDFGTPRDVLRFYSGMTDRTWMAPGLAYYVSTSTSKTSHIKVLEGTYFPSVGLVKSEDIALDGAIVKLSSIDRMPEPQWNRRYEQQVRVLQKTDKPYTPHIDSDEVYVRDLLAALVLRAPVWDLLRISAKIGGGIWEIHLVFKNFVMNHTYNKGGFEKDDGRFFEGMSKTALFDTTQINADDAIEPLLSCRLDLDIFNPELVDSAVKVYYNDGTKRSSVDPRAAEETPEQPLHEEPGAKKHKLEPPLAYEEPIAKNEPLAYEEPIANHNEPLAYEEPIAKHKPEPRRKSRKPSYDEQSLRRSGRLRGTHPYYGLT